MPSSRHRRAVRRVSGCGYSRGRFMIASGLWPGALGGTRTSNLQIRRYQRGRPASFRSVRGLGLVSPGCPGGSGASQGCSSVWLPAWLPARRAAGALLMVFKSIRAHSLPSLLPALLTLGAGSPSKIIPRIVTAVGQDLPGRRRLLRGVPAHEPGAQPANGLAPDRGRRDPGNSLAASLCPAVGCSRDTRCAAAQAARH